MAQDKPDRRTMAAVTGTGNPENGPYLAGLVEDDQPESGDSETEFELVPTGGCGPPIRLPKK